MRTILAALSLAVTVPVALAAPALAKPPTSPTPWVSSVLRQHEGFRAEVAYRCTGPKDQEGTISVSLRQPAKPGASTVTTLATAHEDARCDGDERDETIKLAVAAGGLQADQPVWLYTTLVVSGIEVARHKSPAQPVVAAEPSPSPTPSGTGSPESETPSPSPSPTSESETPETETLSPSPSPTSESETPETETLSPSPSPTS